MNNSELHDWLSKATGKKLLSIEGLVYFFEGSRIDPPQEVGFFLKTAILEKSFAIKMASLYFSLLNLLAGAI